MDDLNDLTDEALLERLGTRLSRLRLEKNLTQEALATEAGVHKNTILRMESGGSTQLKNLIRVLRVLRLLPGLDALVPEPLPSPLKQIAEHKKERQRARRAAEPGVGESPWVWGDEEGAGGGFSPRQDAAREPRGKKDSKGKQSRGRRPTP